MQKELKRMTGQEVADDDDEEEDLDEEDDEEHSDDDSEYVLCVFALTFTVSVLTKRKKNKSKQTKTKRKKLKRVLNQVLSFFERFYSQKKVLLTFLNSFTMEQ